MKEPWNFNAVKWRKLVNWVKSLDWKEKSLVEFVREQEEKEEKRRRLEEERKQEDKETE